MGKIKIKLWSLIAYIILIIAIVFLLLTVLRVITLGKSTGDSSLSNSDYSNIPQECRPPAGTDINSWKTHLSHHTETQYCLKYFN